MHVWSAAPTFKPGLSVSPPIQAFMEQPPEGLATDPGSLLPAMVEADAGALAALLSKAVTGALKAGRRHAASLAHLAAFVPANRQGGASCMEIVAASCVELPMACILSAYAYVVCRHVSCMYNTGHTLTLALMAAWCCQGCNTREPCAGRQRGPQGAGGPQEVCATVQHALDDVGCGLATKMWLAGVLICMASKRRVRLSDYFLWLCASLVL